VNCGSERRARQSSKSTEIEIPVHQGKWARKRMSLTHLTEGFGKHCKLEILLRNVVSAP